MSRLFEVSQINGMQLANRFVRSATWECMAAEDGSCTTKLVELMTSLAKGGIGMLITGHAFVRLDGQARPHQLGIYKDELIDAFKDMTHSVHNYDSQIVLQISHGGMFTNPKLIGQTPLAPSKVDILSNSLCREMTNTEIEDIIVAFGQAASRAKEAGFDGVQIHAAHGFLLNQFISPAFNHRTDKYGGTVENRARIVKEVLKQVRAVVGETFPILVKLNSQDFIEGGFTLDDSLQAAIILQENGIDAIELSGGTIISGKLSPFRMGTIPEDQEAYYRNEAKALKERLRVPLILVGGIRTFGVAERLVDEGYADYISMSRPFIREPNLISRWKAGDLRKAKCVSDNGCVKAVFNEEEVYCMVEKKETEKID